MKDFPIVDLYSQREAVRNHVSGWTQSEVLGWLANRGRLSTRQAAHGPAVFWFESSAGIESSFFFKDGDLVFLGDHSTLP